MPRRKQRLIPSMATRAVRCLVAAAMVVMTDCSGGAGQPATPAGAFSETGKVELSPHPAYANSTLTAVVNDLKPSRSPAAVEYRYEWRDNGQLVEGAAGATAPSALFRKGDVVTVTAIAVNGPQPGTAVTSAPVTIQNSAPMIQRLGLMPFPPYSHVTIHAVVQDADVDGDAISYNYRWFKNDEPLQDQTGETLDGDLIEKGDRILVEVTPSDGELNGDVRRSPVITVQNSPPRITSQPTMLLNGEDAYVYAVAAEDPDGDPIIYSLTSAPNGMTIDPEHGLIHWHVTVKDRGVHPIEITVANEDGAKTMQRYDLRIDDLTASPPPSHS